MRDPGTFRAKDHFFPVAFFDGVHWLVLVSASDAPTRTAGQRDAGDPERPSLAAVDGVERLGCRSRLPVRNEIADRDDGLRAARNATWDGFDFVSTCFGTVCVAGLVALTTIVQPRPLHLNDGIEILGHGLDRDPTPDSRRPPPDP